jgi:indolepyruvate ferredoxin oxidoreductase beta subunit
MESLRYLPYLHEDGWLVTNSKPFVNISNYPDIEKIYSEIKKIKNHILIDADGIAAQLNAAKSANMVMLGAAFAFIGIERKYFETAIRNLFGRKGEEIVNINISAFNAGVEFTEQYIKK